MKKITYLHQRKVLIKDSIEQGADAQEAETRIMNLSKQRIYQLWKIREGKCQICGKKEESTKGMCDYHWKQKAIHTRDWYRKKYGYDAGTPTKHFD